jgi:hypothetical protein
MISLADSERKLSCLAIGALRHYTAHGQAAVKKKLPVVDSELLALFPKVIGDAIDV